MKITLLGTAAAPAIPLAFCSCPTCEHARVNKGRNVRKRCSYLINDDLIVDLGPDVIASCGMYGISLANLKYALVTHSHADHILPQNLALRRFCDRKPSLLQVAAPDSVWKKVDDFGVDDEEAVIERLRISPSDSFSFPPYRITALEANHAREDGDAVNFMLDDGRVKALIASDTGIYDEHVWEKLQGLGLNLLLIECSLGHQKAAKTHLNFEGVDVMISRMRGIDVIDSNTRIVVTHFGHRHVPPHEEIAAMLGDKGLECAYDGMVLVI